MKRELDVFQKHQLKIAKATLKMTDGGVAVMGGMDKHDARAFLRRIGYSTQQIEALEVQ